MAQGLSWVSCCLGSVCPTSTITLLKQARADLTGTSTVHQVLFEAQGRSAKGKAVELEDMKFHQCVRLARFENDRTISFIPPDGAFDLM